MPVKIDVGGPCICWNEENFRCYRNTSGRVIGKFCIECHVEWLARRYLPVTSGQDSPDSAPNEDTDIFYLFLSEPAEVVENKAFQIRSARTKIDPKQFASELKRGDHIAWHRTYVIWHHAIVSEIHPKEGKIDVIQWNKKDNSIQILEESLSVQERNGLLFNQMYRIDYPKEVAESNSTELVLARARSRIGDKGYKPFIDNCETFATYCVTGSAKSHQVAWLKGKVKELIGETGVATVKAFVKGGCRAASEVARAMPKAAGEIIPAEVIEEVINGCDLVGAGIVIGLETGFVIWDLSQVYSERKDGKLSRDDFVEEFLRRVVEGLMTAGFAIAGSIGMEFAIGSLAGTPFGPMGIFLGGIAGGIICGAVGKVIGTWFGSVTGKVIAGQFKDDRAVTAIGELQPGDHIVLCGWFLHPRCHAILVEHDSKEEIKVIRNTYEKGVIEEMMLFSQPLYRVIYEKDTCVHPEEVIENAQSKLGQYKYNLLTYNCKTFAEECKTTKRPIELDLNGIALNANNFNSELF